MLGTVGKKVRVQVQTPNHLERDLFTVIWKKINIESNGKCLSLISLCAFIYLFQNNCFNSWSKL